jgi:cell wall-associated NlpC family hydrolase
VKQKAIRLGVMSVAIAALLVPGFAVAPASAAPNLQQVRMQVMDLQGKAEAANERYNDARNRLGGIQKQLDTLKAKAKRERKQLNEIMGSVDDLARATYTSGGIDTSLQVLLAEDPNQFLSQAAALDQVQKGQASAIRGSQTTRLRLAQTEAAMLDKETAAKKVRSEMGDSKAEANDRYRDAQAILSNLEASERRRIAAMAAAERSAALSAARAASAAISSGSGASGSGASASGSSGGGFTGSGRVARVVQYGLAQVGDRYVAAASGPSAFDCSGLTMTAWRQAGVSLPHYSRSQFSTTRRVPLSQAQPGDLVFYFGSGAHHVGLYIGNGKMVHAANPSSGVLISDVMGPWYNSRFSGIGRVIG